MTTAPFFNVTDYGAVGDDTHDDTTNIQNAINAAIAAGGTVYFPGGIFKITSALTPAANINIIGSGAPSTIIKQHTTNTHGFSVADIHNFVMRDLQLLGTGSGTGVGIHFTLSGNNSMEQLLFENVIVSDWGSDNILLSNPITSSLINVNSESAGQYGFNITGVPSGDSGTSTSFMGCYANANATAGFRLYNMVYSSMSGCAADSNPIGYLIDTCQGVSIQGSGAESNTTNGYKITGSSGITVISPWFFDNQGVAIYVTSSSQTVTIIGAVDFTPNISATAFIKTDTGTLVALINNKEVTANSLASDTVPLKLDDGGDTLLNGDVTIGGVTNFSDAANWGGNANLYSPATDKLQTDGEFSIGGQTDFGDVATWGGDANLYSPATDKIQTDGTLEVGTDLIVDGQTTFSDTVNFGGTANLYLGSANHIATDGSLDVGTNQTISGSLAIGGNVGFYGTAVHSKITVTGSRSSNAALASLLTALANLGLITNSTT